MKTDKVVRNTSAAGSIRRLGIAAATIFLLLSPITGRSETTTLMFSVSARGEFNDNIFYNASENTDELITTLSPSLTYRRMSERLDISLKGSLAHRFYQNENDLGETDQTYGSSFNYVATERLTIGGNAGYTIDSRRDRDIETTGIVLNNVVRERQSAGTGVQYLLSENNTVGLNLSFGEDTFDDSEYNDFEMQHIDAWFSRRLTLDTTMQVNLGNDHYSYPQVEVDNYSLTAGAGTRLSEFLTLSAYIGGRYTLSRYEITHPILYWITSRYETDETSMVGQVGVSYSGEFTQWELGFQHDIQAASGRSGTSQRTGTTCSITRRLTENVSLLASASFFSNRADGSDYGTGEIDERTIMFRPVIRWRINDRFSVDAAYRYLKEKENINDIERDGNVFWVRLTYRTDLLELLNPQP